MKDDRATTRRRFLGTAAGATGVALASVAWPAGQAAAAVPETDRAPASPIGGDKRGYTAGKFAFEFGGAAAEWVHSAEGGHATADVVTEKMGADHLSKKHLGNIKYEDLSVAVGAGMSKAFYSWIAASWQANYQRKNGTLLTADFNNNPIKKLEFFNALITETGMPALDGSSKDAALIDVTFTPETTRLNRKVSGPVVAAVAAKQKQWIVSNFRLTIDGLDCSRVSKIEALVVKQKFVENPVGENRDYQKEPGALEFPNLAVTLAESSAESWYTWFEDFVVKGNNGQAQEKNGKLEYLSPNLQDVLFTVEFKHLGIFKLEPDNGVQNADNIVRLRAEMYVEQMTFAQGPVVGPNDTA